MAIAFDAKTEDRTTTGNTLNFSHTCTGSDRFLYVHVTSLSSVHTGASATYNGVAMTAVATEVVVFGTTWRHHSFYLANPASGSNTVSITFDNITISQRAGCMSYTGVDQSSPILASNTGNSGSGGNMLIPLTTSDDGWFIISGSNVDAAFAAGANTDTLRNSYSGLSDSADSNNDIAAGTTNAQMTHTGTRGWGGIAIAIKPSTGGGGGVTPPNFLGFAGL